jgi:uncharacterized protein (TIGR03086 family)
MAVLLEQWDRVVAGFTSRLDAVQDSQWDLPTPCSEWTVRGLVEHALAAQQGIPKQLGADVDVDLADLRAAFATVVGRARAAYEVPGNLAKTVEGPFGPMPCDQAMGLPTTDLLVHTWDLARAIGADEALDAEAVETAFGRLKPLDAMIRRPGAFGPRVEPPAGADAQTEFLCFLGRQV